MEPTKVRGGVRERRRRRERIIVASAAKPWMSVVVDKTSATMVSRSVLANEIHQVAYVSSIRPTVELHQIVSLASPSPILVPHSRDADWEEKPLRVPIWLIKLKVAEHVDASVEDWNNKKPPVPVLVYFNADDLRKQAEASTKRFQQGNPICILDGIFVAINDDIDCFPYPSKGATIFFDKICTVEKDAVCVARLRKCGLIFIRKTNMHDLGLGVTENNPDYGSNTLC